MIPLALVGRIFLSYNNFIPHHSILLSSSYSALANMSQSNLFNIVFVLGPPGSGKGTQCAKICKEFGFVHLSAGELLRQEMASKSEYCDIISQHIKEGTIVPVEITCALLEKAMRKFQQMQLAAGDATNNHKSDCGWGNNFLVDGFPRNEDNLVGWRKNIGDKANVRFVLALKCSSQTSLVRCLARGLAGSGRSDDNEESFKKRLVTYHEQTLPIINYYDKLGIVKFVETDDTEEKVYEKVRKFFLDYVKQQH